MLVGVRKAALACLLGSFALAYALSTWWQEWLGAAVHYVGVVASVLLLARADDRDDRDAAGLEGWPQRR